MATSQQTPAEQVLATIKLERERQEILRGQRNWGPLEAEDYHVLNTVLTEEVGEVAKATLELGRASERNQEARLLELYEEAIQVAAVAAQIAEKVLAEMLNKATPTNGKEAS